ncbi:MAG: zinc ribbon domain-containing protein [Opitutaceae bacterium]|jgi:predicted nucleic acid-binding Zn ribbon protein|nr:zinc ribbon domain-containing protein [Opitutaceae bacterium]
MSRPPPPRYCAICGAELSPNARACPECGADERTGWREQDPTDGLDLPDTEDTAEAHARFLREMEPQPRQGRSRARHLIIIAITIGIVAVFLMSMFRMR